MSNNIVFISEERVRELINWEDTVEATQVALCSVSSGRAVQSPRTFTNTSNPQNALLTMPGYLKDDKFSALGCKLLTIFPGNSAPTPSILANIALFDENTGHLQAIIGATEITTWRTAAASVIATKYLHGKRKHILAILGSGVQGRIHAIAFQHFFKFKEVHIWNHNNTNAVILTNELNSNSFDKEFKSFENVADCVRNADVIVTATSATLPILKLDWVAKGAHINAVGVTQGHNHAELEMAIYKSADIYIDCWSGAKSELSGLTDVGIQFKGEIGNVIAGSMLPSKQPETISIFQSLGMAVEDCAMARMIYNLHVK